MLTIKPEGKFGHCALLDEEGKEVGAATARPSSRIGYVTIISDTPLDHAIRVPVDWPATLEQEP